MAIATSISLLEHCDHLFFPDINAHLQSWAILAPIDNSYGRLRLVCRMFNTLLGASPHYIMRGPDDPIPTNARAVYISVRRISKECISRLLGEPSISRRLLHLDLPTSDDDGLLDRPAGLDLLLQNSRSLPNLQCLTLKFTFVWENMDSRFWVTLNDAFPFLRRLVLIQMAYPDNSQVLCGEGDTEIIFRNLELLRVDNRMRLVSTLRFPRLRHVSLNTCSKAELEILALSPLLESSLFEEIVRGTIIDLITFPRLRVLGVPIWEEITLLPVSHDHPLEHLLIYVLVGRISHSDLSSIMWLSELLPGVSRFTLDPLEKHVAPLERMLLQDADLRSIFRLSICSTPDGGSRIVLKRSRVDPQMSAQPRPIKQRRFFKWIQSKIRR
jgi:hypothetical protein